jgi:hypothetical protein
MELGKSVEMGGQVRDDQRDPHVTAGRSRKLKIWRPSTPVDLQL